jgi:hypothetical protein
MAAHSRRRPRWRITPAHGLRSCMTGAPMRSRSMKSSGWGFEYSRRPDEHCDYLRPCPHAGDDCGEPRTSWPASSSLAVSLPDTLLTLYEAFDVAAGNKQGCRSPPTLGAMVHLSRILHIITPRHRRKNLLALTKKSARKHRYICQQHNVS